MKKDSKSRLHSEEDPLKRIIYVEKKRDEKIYSQVLRAINFISCLSVKLLL